MANLVKISEMLKSASDQQLASELNTPNATVPSYLVLSELQRRKKLRGSLMSPEPQTSVAEDLEMESSRANQMGIGALQQPQEPQGYAGGGEVRRFNGEEGSYIDPYFGAGQYDVGPGIAQSMRNRLDYLKRQRELEAAGKTYATNPAVAAYLKQYGSQLQESPDYSKFMQDPNAYVLGQQALYAKQNQVPPVATGGQGAGKPRVDVGAGIPAAAAAKGVQSPAATQTANPIMDELKGYRKELADLYKNQADIYKQQSDELKESKGSDAAMAAILAGLGIAGGKSQNAITNIAEGAIPGIQQYAASERERQKELQKLALGQGALGIERLGAQMKGAATEGELGIKERAVGADEMKARAAMMSAGAQSNYYKQAIAQAKTENDAAKIASSVINSSGFGMMAPEDQQFFLSMAKQGLMNRFPGVSGTMTGIPQGVKVTPIK